MLKQFIKMIMDQNEAARPISLQKDVFNTAFGLHLQIYKYMFSLISKIAKVIIVIEFYM